MRTGNCRRSASWVWTPAAPAAPAPPAAHCCDSGTPASRCGGRCARPRRPSAGRTSRSWCPADSPHRCTTGPSPPPPAPMSPLWSYRTRQGPPAPTRSCAAAAPPFPAAALKRSAFPSSPAPPLLPLCSPSVSFSPVHTLPAADTPPRRLRFSVSFHYSPPRRRRQSRPRRIAKSGKSCYAYHQFL